MAVSGLRESYVGVPPGMNAKRVMYVVPVLAPYLAARFRELAKVAAFELNVVIESRLFPERPGWVPVEIAGATVIPLNSPQWTKRISDKQSVFNNAYTKALPLGLIPAIIRQRPAVVVVCNPTQYCLALVARLFSRFRLGVVLEDTPTSEGRKKPWVQRLRALMYRFATFFVCFSQDADDYARSIAPAVHRYRSSWSIDADWLQLPRVESSTEQQVRVLYVGALIELKGVAQLIAAWHALGARSANAELILVGDGELRPELESMVVSSGLTNVIFVGSVPYDQVRGHYLSADIFVLPTLQDLFSLVVTEAMAMGLPVITTVYNGARELVVEDVTGYMCDPLIADSLRAALERALLARAKLGKMGLAARSRMAELTHARVMAETVKILDAEVRQCQ